MTAIDMYRFHGITIDRTPSSGMYGARLDSGRYMRADTYCGILDTLGGRRDGRDSRFYDLCFCDSCAPEDDECTHANIRVDSIESDGREIDVTWCHGCGEELGRVAA